MDTNAAQAPLESNAFITLLTSPWFFAVVGGFIILGIVIFIASQRAKKRTPLEQLQGELGARRLYHKDEARRNERV